MNATDTIKKAQEENRLEREIAYFMNNWAPKNPSDRTAFEAHFFRIVHTIHTEASKPFIDAMMRGMALQPLGPIVLKGSGNERG